MTGYCSLIKVIKSQKSIRHRRMQYTCTVLLLQFAFGIYQNTVISACNWEAQSPVRFVVMKNQTCHGYNANSFNNDFAVGTLKLLSLFAATRNHWTRLWSLRNRTLVTSQSAEEVQYIQAQVFNIFQLSSSFAHTWLRWGNHYYLSSVVLFIIDKIKSPIEGGSPFSSPLRALLVVGKRNPGKC